MIRLTDEQWERIRKHFPEEHIADGRPGRKPIPTRRVLEAVLWLLNTGAQWHMLPQSYPNYKTVHRRFQAWCRDEILRRLLTDVANELRDRGALDEEECFIDATFVMAKGGGAEIGATKRGKGMKIMAIVDRHGLPLSVSTHAANHHEVRLVQLCFDFYMIEAKPENLIGDRAYDSDPLDEELRRDGIEMIAPHRANRSKPPTQDRRRLTRYMRRAHNIPPGAVEKVAARRVYPVMAPADYQGRSAGAPVKGPRGLIVSIAECEPGNGPGLHRHLNTVENFFCLTGRFEIAWGDRGEHRLVLEPLDMISVPRGENRSFRNVSNELGRLLVMIVPETDEQVDPVSYAPSLAKDIENEYGKTALAGLQKIGFRFEDESGS